MIRVVVELDEVKDKDIINRIDQMKSLFNENTRNKAVKKFLRNGRVM